MAIFIFQHCMWAHEALIQGPDGGRPPYSGSPPSLATKRTINAIRRPDGGPIGGRPPYSGGPPIPDKTYHKRDSEARRRPASECRRPAIPGETYHAGARGPGQEARGGRPPNAGGPPSFANRTIHAIRRPEETWDFIILNKGLRTAWGLRARGTAREPG